MKAKVDILTLDNEADLEFSGNHSYIVDELIQAIRNQRWKDDRIYLIALECSFDDKEHNIHSTEIIVTINRKTAIAFIEDYLVANEGEKEIRLFFQDYECFEDAYLVCKDMREPHPLCYAP